MWYLVTQLYRLFATPWTVAHQVPLPMGILQARILEWVALFQEIFPTQGSNLGFPHSRQTRYYLSYSPLIFRAYFVNVISVESTDIATTQMVLNLLKMMETKTFIEIF